MLALSGTRKGPIRPPRGAVRRQEDVMNTLTRLAAVAAFGLSAGSALGADYAVDAAHTSVGFKVRHILTRLPGQFKVFEGTFSFDPKAPEKTAGHFVAKAASID